MNRGVLIALEGIDGSGKTTQRDRLAEYIRRRHQRVVQVTEEPSDGPVGLLLRGALGGTPSLDEASLALLFAADRLDHIEREINPRLAAGDVVLSDRYLLSSLAYQSTYLPLDWVAAINARAPRPHLSIILEVAPATAAARRQARGTRHERFDDEDRQRRLARAYSLVLSRTDIDVGPSCVVDAERSPDLVARDLAARVDAVLASPDRAPDGGGGSTGVAANAHPNPNPGRVAP